MQSAQDQAVHELGDKGKKAFGFCLCIPQLLSAWHQLQGKTVFTIAPTGFGKTLTFWIPLLASNDGILIIVTRLNILGDKNAQESMEKLGILGVNVTGDNSGKEVFKEINDLKHRVIVASPELLVEHEGFHALYTNPKFTSKLINITFDKAHCIILWSGDDFRPEYKMTHKLRWFIPKGIPFHFVSATMPPSIQEEIKHTFLVKDDTAEEIRMSNDCQNIHIQIVKMKYAKTSIKDLRRVL
ncbi:hypothetical protein BT96DRAFT_984238 [Gymnopus androsaceus JB14]|uniref:Helicase ATP-binding domain-containing protein n=1 Tax=Gymnopus androsaceus JB14 TaxID=1447944 RepID=A0A6A4IL92_9AGAR|nr:hypothetical protein BT96DRAFT_984238 [Gymnopus androsaceus JB14]